ncbi:MAG: SseB family protein [Ornithinimicrobium sp.]
MSERFADHDPAAGTDTAGVPWQGRTLTGTGFDADDGAIDPKLSSALAERGDEDALVAAVAQARIMVPIVAIPGQGASTDMASVTISAPDGTKALVAFSSTTSMSAWDTSARPVPVSAQRAALAAVQEGCDVIVIDVGSTDPVTLRSSMVWALAMDRAWQPAHIDPQVRAAIDDACSGETSITARELTLGPAGELIVTLAVVPGLDADRVQSAVRALAERIATDGETRSRIDAIRFRITQAP